MKTFASLLLCLLAAPALAQNQKGEIVVAIRQTKLKTSTFLFKFPLEAQRGERWEILKYGGTVVLNFAPQDERRIRMEEILAQHGKMIKKMVGSGYELDRKVFDGAFVLETDWPRARKALASELQKQFSGLSVEQCEKLIEGELWIGMSRDYAAESVGTRVLRKETSENADGKSEIWRVGSYSRMTTGESLASEQHVEGIFASPSHPQDTSHEAMNRDLERSVRIVLTFKDGALAEIVRR